MQELFRLKISALDDYNTPVVRVNGSGVITYINRAGQNLFGVTPAEHINLRILFPDNKEYAKVSDGLMARLEGELANYEAEFQPPHAPTDSAPVPIRIFAFPESDEDGNVLGSLAIIHDRREESIRTEIHAAIEQSASNDQLFHAVAGQLRRVFDFDTFRVTAISRSREHLRSMFSTDPNAKIDYPFRWWRVPAFIEKELNYLSARVVDIDDMFRRPEFSRLAETDLATRKFIASGVKSVLNIPVMESGQLVAIIALDSFQPHHFKNFDRTQLLGLPIVQAVVTALYRERRNESDAVFELLRHASASSHDVKHVAEKLVTSLVAQGWSHVSIFQSDVARNRMRMVCQANRDDSRALDEPCFLELNLHDGKPANAVAEAVITDRRVGESTSRARGPYGQTGATPPVGSQLVLPIRSPRDRWALNVESEEVGSFAEEEIGLLELLAAEAGAVLYRSSLFELQTAVLRSINDAVIETDEQSIIRWSNAAAKRMLNLPDLQDEPLSFGELIADSRLRDTLAQTEYLDHRELNLRTTKGKPLPVLLSISTLPEHLGGRVHVASDFTYQKEVQRMGELKEVFRHAALEGRIPLSLATIWLRQYAEETPEASTMIEKVMAQLGRADLPLERLMRLFTEESKPTPSPYCDLGRAVNTTLAELPELAQRSIEAQLEDCPQPVPINFEDLQFCVESMISFGLRTQPQAKSLFVSTNIRDGRARCRIWGDWEAYFNSAGGTSSTERWRRKSLGDLTLGDKVIRRLVRRAGGSYQRSFGPALSFEIALPLSV